MASVFSRIFVSFDRLPAPMAFSSMVMIGGVEAYALLDGDLASSKIWYIRAAPFVGFGGMAILGLLFVVSSRPVVVHRETGSLLERFSAHLQHLGRLATLHAVAATILIIPALVITGKLADLTPKESETNSDESAESALIPIPPATSAFVLPTPSTLPSATADKPPPPPVVQPSSNTAPITSVRPVTIRNPQPWTVPTPRSSTSGGGGSPKPLFRPPETSSVGISDKPGRPKPPTPADMP